MRKRAGAGGCLHTGKWWLSEEGWVLVRWCPLAPGLALNSSLRDLGSTGGHGREQVGGGVQVGVSSLSPSPPRGTWVAHQSFCFHL